MPINEKATDELFELMHRKTFGTEESMEKIQAGANPDVKTSKGNTLLHKLINFNRTGGNTEAILDLINKYQANVNIVNDSCQTPLKVMLDSGLFYSEIAMELVRSGADPNTRSDRGETILHYLIKDKKNKFLIQELVAIFKTNTDIKPDGVSLLKLARRLFTESDTREILLEPTQEFIRAIEQDDVKKVEQYLSNNRKWLEIPLNSKGVNAIQFMARSKNPTLQKIVNEEDKKDRETAMSLRNDFDFSRDKNNPFNHIKLTAKKNVYAKKYLAELYFNNKQPFFSFEKYKIALELYTELSQINEKDFFSSMMRDRLLFKGISIKQFKTNANKEYLMISSLKNAFRVSTDDEHERLIAENYIKEVADNKKYTPKWQCIAKTMEAILSKSDEKWLEAQQMDLETFTHICNWVGLESGTVDIQLPETPLPFAPLLR